MFHHPSVQKNIDILQSYGNLLISPQEGELASGLCGAGRMEEPDQIIQVLSDYFAEAKELHGKKILVTAGPTYEPIDPVRFIGNYSSGKMGFSLAEVLARKGAEVTLVTGPTVLDTPARIKNRIDVHTAVQMAEVCYDVARDSDVVVMAAAVADYAPVSIAKSKIKKSEEVTSLELKKNPDILAELGKRKKKGQILAGFALETDNEKENALTKLQNKNLDLIVLNSLKDLGAGFNTDTNKVNVLFKNGEIKEFPLKDKTLVAGDIAAIIKDLLDS
jgi:phosphopantothenoylcysteine decarboxylase/phosphopantothenate--cysteine ligase